MKARFATMIVMAACCASALVAPASIWPSAAYAESAPATDAQPPAKDATATADAAGSGQAKAAKPADEAARCGSCNIAGCGCSQDVAAEPAPAKKAGCGCQHAEQ